MRTLCIEEFNEEYNLNTSLKKKQKGRNRDIHVSDMDNYIEMKKQLEKNSKNLENVNKKSLELQQNSKDIKDKIALEEFMNAYLEEGIVFNEKYDICPDYCYLESKIKE